MNPKIERQLNQAAIIHRVGLFPRSDGTIHTWCGLTLPDTPEHCHTMGSPKPTRWRWCKRCAAIWKKHPWYIETMWRKQDETRPSFV